MSLWPYTDAIKKITVDAVIAGNGATVANIFKFDGTVRIIHQEAAIIAVTDIVTCSNVYATVYDGTNTKNLTADGIDLSGAPVGSWFVKDQVAAQPYSLNLADEVRVNEIVDAKKAGRPFNVTAKTGADNFIQFRFTGDANTNFAMHVLFEYQLFNGATLGLA